MQIQMIDDMFGRGYVFDYKSTWDFRGQKKELSLSAEAR